MKNRPLHERMRFALAGLRAGLATEHSVRTEALALVIWLGVLCWLQPAPMWWALSILSMLLITAVELLNSALEAAVDRLHPERHPAIGMAKDMAAGAVFLTVLAGLTVGALTVWSVLG
ncbi:MAG: diacylglycerol kinase [Planctomycetota bacterium]|jgi:diacylglycerol kinase (ATP)